MTSYLVAIVFVVRTRSQDIWKRRTWIDPQLYLSFIEEEIQWRNENN